LDEKDWAGLEALFVEDVMVEIGGAAGAGDRPRSFRGRRDFLEELQQLMAPLVTVHQVSAPEIKILSQTDAAGIWAVADRLVFPAGSPIRVLQGYGHYREEYRKLQGRWSIASMRLTRLLVETTSEQSTGAARISAGGSP
jgi:hypothetical protein